MGERAPSVLAQRRMHDSNATHGHDGFETPKPLRPRAAQTAPAVTLRLKHSESVMDTDVVKGGDHFGHVEVRFEVEMCAMLELEQKNNYNPP